MELNNIYLTLLEKNLKNEKELALELIKTQAILNLPKGTEHFISDLHGEYGTVRHILNSCSGVIKEKLELLEPTLEKDELNDILAMIYYPSEYFLNHSFTKSFYKERLILLLRLTSLIASKYSRHYVKKNIASEYVYVIDELLHTKDNIETNTKLYFNNIIEAIINNDEAINYLKELIRLIKKFAVSKLHVLGDIYDRGEEPDRIIELLSEYDNIDIEYGNHDILWIGAYYGSAINAFYVLFNNLKYHNFHILENVYGISLRKIYNYAIKKYPNCNQIDPLLKTIALIMFKLERKIIKRNPTFNLNNRLVLEYIKDNKYIYNNQEYLLKDDLKIDSLELNKEEKEIVLEIVNDFKNSKELKRHIEFIVLNGFVYKVYNNNLLFHGCIPLDLNGDFKEVNILGTKLKGKAYLDYIDKLINKGLNNKLSLEELDYFYYLWNGFDSPFTGRVYKTFELLMLDDKEIQKEARNYYYEYRYNKDICLKILAEFNLNKTSHIINGHLPVKVKKGEKPVLAGGKLLVIDGGFCEAYHEQTGIAGYTLINNSHGLRIVSHSEFLGLNHYLKTKEDIISKSVIVETYKERKLIKDTDQGKVLLTYQNELKELKKNGIFRS